MKSKEVEYANASAAIKSDNNKTNLFFMYEQEITKLNRQIHYANKVSVGLHYAVVLYDNTTYSLTALITYLRCCTDFRLPFVLFVVTHLH